jgi:hypothetical protein
MLELWTRIVRCSLAEEGIQIREVREGVLNVSNIGGRRA